MATHHTPPLSSSPVGAQAPARRRADGNVAAVSHDQHVPTPIAAAARRANMAVSKAAWWPWLSTFWPWKWCPSHVWRGYLCANFTLPRLLCLIDVGLVRDRRTPSPDGRGNVLAVRNCCYVAVCLAARGASAPTGTTGRSRVYRGGRPPTSCFVYFEWISSWILIFIVELSSLALCRSYYLENTRIWYGRIMDIVIYWMFWLLYLSPAHRRVLVSNRVRDSISYFLVVSQSLDYQDYSSSHRTVVQPSR